MPAPTTLHEYLASVLDDRRAVLEELQQTIRAAAPDTSKTIAENPERGTR